MANSRYRYPADSYVEAPREKPESGSGRTARVEDPLAELARLIGQEDPFKDFYKDEPLVRSQPAEPDPYRDAPRARRAEDARYANPGPASYRDEPPPRAPAETFARQARPAPAEPSYRDEPPRAAPADPHARQARPAPAEPAYRDEPPPRAPADPYARQARPAPAEPAYRDEPPPRVPADFYARQARPAPAEPAYRDEPPPRARRGEEGRYSNPGATAYASEPAQQPAARAGAETFSRQAHGLPRSEPAGGAAADPGMARRDYERAPASEPRRRTEAAQPAYAPAYDPGAYDRDFGPEDQAFDPYYGEHDQGPDDAYDEPLPRRRSRLMLLVAGTAVGLAALGIGGVFAYRALLGGGSPPTIKADAGPNKVAPSGQSDSGNQKLIYDRVGAPGKGTERVVSREEQPVDPARASPRVVLPGAPVAEEPRKVRTITVRADGSMVMPPPQPTAPPQPAPTVPRTVAVMPMPQPAAAPPAAPAVPAPRAVAPRPVQPAPPAQPSMRVASTPPAAPATDTSVAGYVVQISAGKSDSDARAALRTAQSRYAELLGRQPTTVQRVELERGTFYRAQFGPFGNRDEANDLCGKLRSAGGTCVVQHRN